MRSGSRTLLVALSLAFCAGVRCEGQEQLSRLPYTREASVLSHLLVTPRDQLDEAAIQSLVEIIENDSKAYAEWFGPGPSPAIGELAARRLAGLNLPTEIREKIIARMTSADINEPRFSRFVSAVGIGSLSALQAARICDFCEFVDQKYGEIVLVAISQLPNCIDGKFDPLIDRSIASRDTRQLVLAASAILKRCNKVSCWNNRIIDACSEPLPGHLAVTPDTRQPFDQRLILLRCLAHNGYPTRRLKDFVAASHTGAGLEYSLLVHAINWQIFGDEQSLDAIMRTLNRGETRATKEAAARIVSRDILLPKRLSAELARLLDSTTGLVAAYVSIAVVRNFTLADFDGEQLNRMLNHRDPGVAQRLLDWHSEQSPTQSVPPLTESRNENER